MIKAIVAVHYYIHTATDDPQFLISECVVADNSSEDISESINRTMAERATHLTSVTASLGGKAVSVRGRIQSVTIIPNEGSSA